jgi:signal transduction histidine kinase
MRWEFLAQASVVLGASLDYGETLRRLAQLFVPSLADWCSVDVADAGGNIRRLALAYADPTKDEIAERATAYPPDPGMRHPRTRVLATGRSILVPEVTDAGLVPYGEAQEANRLKDEFLASVSHELRTPLQAMLGWVGVLRQGKYTPERHARALEIIERSGRAQAKLIEDILDVSRIATGRLRLELRPLDPIPLLEEALDAMRPAAEAKKVALEAALAPGASTVAADPVRLRQVAWNLLSNAVKFTPGGGRVQMRLERDASEVRIVVKDTGQGIRAEFLPHVFEPFRQGETTSRRGHGGLGLGLAIVRSVVELHGGRVEARSEGEGRGAEFIITLPAADVIAAACSAS